MKCVFCQKDVESVDEAVQLGWYPDVWVGEVNYQGPVCDECQTEHLLVAEDGEFVLKPDHAVPPDAVRMGYVEIKKEMNVPETHIMKPKFPLGQLLATPGALQAMQESGQSPAFFLDQHVQGMWGEDCDEDKRANDQALVDGSRILSAFRTLRNTRIWIITEAADDEGRRTSTTCLLPSEY